MSEPSEVAQAVEEVVPGLWHWRVHDDRIDFLSAGHALASGDGVVLDRPAAPRPRGARRPRPVFGDLPHLRKPRALGLAASPRAGGARARAGTLTSHRRGAGRPYGDGDLLPGGLRAVFTPGAGTTQHALSASPSRRSRSSPICSRRRRTGRLRWCRRTYMHDPGEARRSVEKLLDLPFSILCLGHGVPVTADPKAALRAALADSS